MEVTASTGDVHSGGYGVHGDVHSGGYSATVETAVVGTVPQWRLQWWTHPDPYHGGVPLHARARTTPCTRVPHYPVHHHPVYTTVTAVPPEPSCRDNNVSFPEISADGVLGKTTVSV